MALLDGKALAKQLHEEVKAGVLAFASQYGRAPALDVVLVGNDPASQIYVRNKGKACAKVGITSNEHRLPASTTTAELLALVARLNADSRVDGILVQMPLPLHILSHEIIEAIQPSKDVDGLSSTSLGLLVSGQAGLRPCTPSGCLRLLDSVGVPLAGVRAAVVGRSILVGKPMALLLLERHATVTLCHSRTSDLKEIIEVSDVVVAAVGKAELVKGAWIKPGAAVIDVGMNRLESGELRGDVEFAPAAKRAAWITPVPGGVGPMTIACLLVNTLQAAKLRQDA